MSEGQITVLNGLFVVAMVVMLLTGGATPSHALRLPHVTWEQLAEALQSSEPWACPSADVPMECSAPWEQPKAAVALD